MGGHAHEAEPGGAVPPDADLAGAGTVDAVADADVTGGAVAGPGADSVPTGPGEDSVPTGSLEERAGVPFEPDRFRSQHPEFHDLTDEALNIHVQTADLLLSGALARNAPDRALSLGMRRILLEALVCHLATLARQKGGASGPVTGATMGSISLSFGRPASDPDPFLSWLEQTGCGAFAALLLRRLPRNGPCLVRARRR
ncbi:DUF4054 domain-containing protein [Phaeovibrio sulfidiphilus]|uniref:DUF4054 domain-containing protein n=1 Tax=Phaeovibrio sulfidiphilus TaxID=1220600 RepID=A0A8J6YN18_9PROT|nr:DUF4054 domain-containing protein [Phaeovibrio sulfidiphilus]MBE1237490.1 DUF4054 domain-containing protein [Phaeovibrio sulfidiphilus]